MASYNDTVDADRRLVILRFLTDQPGGNLNAALMQDLLGRVGHSVSRDQVINDFNWLEEQRLISIDEFDGGRVRIAVIAQRGVECARGIVRIEGVARPSPGA